MRRYRLLRAIGDPDGYHTAQDAERALHEMAAAAQIDNATDGEEIILFDAQGYPPDTFVLSVKRVVDAVSVRKQ